MSVADRVRKYADHIDHPDHGENEEREDTCRTCRKYAFGRAPWPCLNARIATELRAIVGDDE